MKGRGREESEGKGVKRRGGESEGKGERGE